MNPLPPKCYLRLKIWLLGVRCIGLATAEAVTELTRLNSVSVTDVAVNPEILKVLHIILNGLDLLKPWLCCKNETYPPIKSFPSAFETVVH